MKCAKCGTVFEGKFCPKCGAPAKKKSHAGAVAGGIVLAAAVIAAGAAVFLFGQKRAEIISAVQEAAFAAPGGGQAAYGELLAAFPEGKWDCDVLPGRGGGGDEGLKEVTFTGTHPLDDAVEQVSVTFGYSEADKTVRDVEIYDDGTALGDSGTNVVLLLLRESGLDGESAEKARQMLDMPLTEVESACALANVKAGALVGYPDALCGQTLETALPGGTWSYASAPAAPAAVYEAGHAFTGGSEQMRLAFAPDVMSDVSKLTALSVDGETLSDIEASVVLEALVSAAGGSQEAQNALAAGTHGMLVMSVTELFRSMSPSGWDADFGTVFDAAFTGGAWSYQGDGQAQFDGRLEDGGDVSIQYTLTGLNGGYDVEVYLDGQRQDKAAADQVLADALDRYALSIAPDPVPVAETAWCAGLYCGGADDVNSTVYFYADGTFEISLYRQMLITDCTGMVQGEKLTFTGTLDTGGSAAGELAHQDNGELVLTVTASDDGTFLPVGESRRFRQSYVDYGAYLNVLSTGDYYGYCGTYAQAGDPDNQLELWQDGGSTFIRFLCRGEEVAVADFADWQTVSEGDGFSFTTYTPTNIELSCAIYPGSKTLEIWYVSPTSSVLGQEGFTGKYYAQSYTSSVDRSYGSLIYFIEHSDTEYFDWSYISSFDSEECTLAINGVYARSGRAFQSQELQTYFEQFDWYVPAIAPSDFTEYMLNTIQQSNINLLVEYRDYMGY